MMLESETDIVCRQTSTCADALEFDDVGADIILLHQQWAADVPGLEDLRASQDRARLVILAGSDDVKAACRAAEAGARGLVSTDKPARVLLAAIRKVHDGEVWFQRDAIANLIDSISKPDGGTPLTDEEAKIAILSNREREVVLLVTEGLKNREIAEKLFISEVTVRHHLTSIFSKLEVRDRIQLMLFAFRTGIADPPKPSPTRARGPAI